MIKATIDPFTLIGKRRIIKYLQKQGFDPAENSNGQLEVIHSDFQIIINLLTDLKYRFPVSYYSGWTEPIKEDDA